MLESDELTAGQPPPAAVLSLLASALRDVDHDVDIDVWSALAARFPACPGVLAHHGDALFDAGREPEALEQLLNAFELAPELVQEFEHVASAAQALGGEIWLRYQIAELRAVLDELEEPGAPRGDGSGELARDDDDANDDDVDERATDIRERYSELLEEYRHDRAAEQRIRALGQRIARLETEGVLPQVLILRGTGRASRG